MIPFFTVSAGDPARDLHHQRDQERELSNAERQARYTSLATIARTRQQLVEEGFDAVLTRKHSPASARPRIFDGAAEAKLIALACSEPPAGRARWTLSLLEDKVVELNIVARASDNTIGRTLKKTASSRT